MVALLGEEKIVVTSHRALKPEKEQELRSRIESWAGVPVLFLPPGTTFRQQR